MLKIDKDICIGCGVCESSCAFAAIEVVNDCAVVNDKCTLCGTCVQNCEVGALTLERDEIDSAACNLSEWSGVLVFAEWRQGRVAPVSYELLGEGRKLADQRGVGLAAIILGHNIGETTDTLIGCGADTVYVVDDSKLADFTDDAYGAILYDIISQQKPEIVLAGATAIGRSVIPRVANMLHAGLTADCTSLAIRQQDGALLATRPAFGGNIMATIACPYSRPQMATVRPNVIPQPVLDDCRHGKVIPIYPESSRLQSRVKVVNTEKTVQDDEVNLHEADVVIAGGRGLEDAEGFALIRELAELMNGAVAASRAAVDNGWIGYTHQVGQTGKTISPKLYITCGISGAIQHVVGMRSADTIVSINIDENAPIFDIANYGLVGDLFEVLPLLIAKIKEQRGL